MQKNIPILFLHGALGTPADLHPLMDLCREKGFVTKSLGFSGHGIGSAFPTDFRIETFAAELDNYFRQEAITEVHVFGYSMGGYVALFHLANFEDSPIATLFTYGTKFNWSAQAVSKELPMLDPDHLEQKFPPFAENLKKKHGENWKHLLRTTAHMMQNLERLDGLTKEDLADVKIPVTLILGDQDRMVTSEETLLTKKWIPHSQMKTVSHSKHDLERANIREISQLISQELLQN